MLLRILMRWRSRLEAARINRPSNSNARTSVPAPQLSAVSQVESLAAVPAVFHVEAERPVAALACLSKALHRRPMGTSEGACNLAYPAAEPTMRVPVVGVEAGSREVVSRMQGRSGRMMGMVGQVMGSGIAVEGPQAVGSTRRLAMVLAETSSMRGCDRGLREEHRSLGRR